MAPRIKATYSGTLLKNTTVPVSEDVLETIGKILVEMFALEAKKDFAKRGWSGLAKDGSAPIWDSFSWRVKGAKTVEVVSTFPDIGMLTGQGMPSYPMTWLTQESKERNPAAFPLSPREKKLGMKSGGRISKGTRLPLVVPLKGEGGTVVFRTAPLTTGKAWIHPGIARFGFAERAQRKAREKCMGVLVGAAVKFLEGALA